MQSEKEISAHEAYKKFLDIMLYDLPLEQLDELVVSDVTGYGTTLDEKILQIERLRKLVVDQREQGAGYKMSFDINPVHRRINTVADSAIFIDEIGITMSINGENHLIPLRFSTALEFINGSWKVVHLHGSVAVVTEGDTWHMNEWQRKNEELQKLVDEKTAELLNKNRELEIEAALEKVRAVAMSMNKPDDLLNICEVLYKEFHSFGFSELRNAMINIHNDEKKTFLNYDYSDKIGKSINHLEYNIHPVIKKQIKQIRSSDDAFSETVFKGADLKSWKAFRKKIGEKDDPRINKSTALYYYFYSIGTGSIGISTFSSIDEEKLGLLKRFRNVFKLSYQRYKDLEQAEAQAKEAQIELALERVRARTMAMQQSDELADTAGVLFQQFVSLGIAPKRCLIGIIDETSDSSEIFFTSTEGKVIPCADLIPLTEQENLKDLYKSWQNKNEHFYFKLEGQKRIDWTTYLMDKAKINMPEYKPNKINLKQLYTEPAIFNTFFFTQGYIFLHTVEDLPESEITVLKRFSAVFEQTYTRFLDLQKAEAQAREGQIEAALERVRSRSMGMQKSEELKEVIRVVYEQFVHLKINVDHAGFVVDYTPRGDCHFWIADEQDIPSKIAHPYFESVWANQFNEAKEKGADFFATNLNFEEKNKFYNELLSYVPGLPEASKDFYLSCPGLAGSTVLFDNVSLYIENFSGIPIPMKRTKY